MGAAARTPRVVAIVVAHDGAEWLGDALRALEAQDYPNLTILAVDNGSQDASRDLLLDRLGTERVLIAERDLGFGAAVNMAADTATAGRADYLFLVHDDAAPDPDVVSGLVAAMEADPALAAVGPKLVRWEDPRTLESVGMTVDATGRADSGLEPDERDQGQRDVVREALYVPTTAMLVRQSDYESIGRLDRRYHVFRDDLDLCWRWWLADRRVEVVPSVRVRHAAGASNYLRLGQTAFLGPRYFAERNTLATLLKLYGRGRLAMVLPLFLLVGIAKVAGFTATRRFGDAWQTLRAWAWNLLHLRETFRLRKAAQSMRQRTDAELQPMFGRVAPRLRAYTEAVTFWLTTGTDDPDDFVEAMDAPTTTRGRVVRFLRANAVVLGGGFLLVAGTMLALPLLASGDVRGGQLLAWPQGGSSPFFRDYAASFHAADGLGTAAAPSPARFLLGVLTFLSFGSSWLAPRVLVLGALPLAWIFSLLAVRRLTPRRVPQVLAATLYVLSPPAIAAVRTGQVPALVVIALLPALFSALLAMISEDVKLATAWRSTAAGALIGAVMVAFAPPVAVVLVPAALILIVAVQWLSLDGEARRGARLRIAAFLAGVLILLFPWSLDLIREGSPALRSLAPHGATPQPFWRLVLLVPEMAGFPVLLAGGGYLAAGVLGLALGLRTRTGAVVGLWAAGVSGALLSWILGRAGDAAIAWQGLPLILAAAAFSALLAVAFAEASTALGRYSFGWRHLLAGVSVLATAAGFVVMLGHVASDPWGAYAIDEPSLPAYIGAEQTAVGDFRVLVLSAQGGELRWDLTGPSGPTMLRFGQPLPVTLAQRVDQDLTDLMGGSDPGAAARLGLASVRWIVVPEAGVTPELDQALGQQLDLEPQPMSQGRVYKVEGWLPRAAVIRLDVLDSVVNQSALPPDARVLALEAQADGVRWDDPRAGALMFAEAAEGRWVATVDGVEAEVRPIDGLVRVDVPEGATSVELRHAQGTRTALMALQLLGLLLGISLVLRPPGFAEAGFRPPPVVQPPSADPPPPAETELASAAAAAPSPAPAATNVRVVEQEGEA